MHILITAFEPFQQESVNATMEALALLPDSVCGHVLTRRVLPVAFGKAIDCIKTLVDELSPDAVICLGQATGRSDVTPERVAINLREASIPDNRGNQPRNTPVAENAPAAYFSTLPVRHMVEAVKAAGVPCALSYSAGVFVCNDLLYTLLHHYDGTPVRVAFIHIPYLPEQAKEGVPSLPLNETVRGLTAAIEVL